MASFLQSGYFQLHAAVQSPREIEHLLDQGVARVALVTPSAVQTLMDGVFANTTVIT